MEEEIIGAITECLKCKYYALTWHKSENEISPCRKCGGKLEVICIEL